MVIRNYSPDDVVRRAPLRQRAARRVRLISLGLLFVLAAGLFNVGLLYYWLTSSIFHSHDAVYVLLGIDLGFVLLYITFFLLAITWAWRRTFGTLTNPVIAFGILFSFFGIIVAFASTYYALGIQWSGQITYNNNPHGIGTEIQAFYFASTIFTSVGFGDITATGHLARDIVSIQMIFTYIYGLTALALIAQTGFGGLPGGRTRLYVPKSFSETFRRALMALRNIAIFSIVLIVVVACLWGLASVLDNRRFIFLPLAGDVLVMAWYVSFFFDVLTFVRSPSRNALTATAVTYGILISFAGILVIFATSYYFLATQWQDQISLDSISSPSDALYFATTILTTVGFGDIHATGELARVVVSTQMLFTFVYVTTALALVAQVTFGSIKGPEPAPAVEGSRLPDSRR